MKERDNEKGSSCGNDAGARRVGGAEVAMGATELTLGEVFILLGAAEYGWLTGLVGYCELFEAVGWLAGASFAFFEAEDEF